MRFWKKLFGKKLSELGRYEEAVEACDRAIELQPDGALAWKNKGVAFFRLRRYEEALEACDRAIELQPDYASAWKNKGVVLNELGRYEKALEACDRVIELQPGLERHGILKACAI